MHWTSTCQMLYSSKMATNGKEVKIAILANDLKYLRQSQDSIAQAVKDGFKEIKTELRDIKSAQKANTDEILVAKSSIKTLKGLVIAIGSVITFAVTIYAAIQ